MILALGCNSLYTSLFFANYCLRKQDIRFKVIFFSTRKLKIGGKTLGPFSAIKFLYDKLGLDFTSFLILQSLTPNILKFIPKYFFADGLWSFNKLAREFDIELMEFEDFNSPVFHQALEKRKIDILVLNCTNQILKEKTIETPREACLNIHPSYLPEYRGVDPIFQMMVNNEEYVASTLHQITKNIDEGPIVARTRSQVRKDLSYFLRIKKSTQLAGDNFKEFLENRRQVIPQNQDKKAINPYRSIPKKDEVNLFKANGHSFVNLSEMKEALKF